MTARKPRTTPPRKKHPRTQKKPGNLRMRNVTVRSRAFGRAILQAKPYTLNPERLERLLREAARKTASLPRKPFRESWAYLHTMLRLLRAHQRGEYTVPSRTLLSIIAAVAYLVDPLDLIPDEIPFLGFLDTARLSARTTSSLNSGLELWA